MNLFTAKHKIQILEHTKTYNEHYFFKSYTKNNFKVS